VITAMSVVRISANGTELPNSCDSSDQSRYVANFD
jgi:hypothetical protein